MPQLTREQIELIVALIVPYCDTTEEQITLFNELFTGVDAKPKALCRQITKYACSLKWNGKKQRVGQMGGNTRRGMAIR
jgi:hypothetical protein